MGKAIVMAAILLVGCAGSRAAGPASSEAPRRASSSASREREFDYFEALAEAQAICGSFEEIAPCMLREYGCTASMSDRECGIRVYEKERR